MSDFLTEGAAKPGNVITTGDGDRGVVVAWPWYKRAWWRVLSVLRIRPYPANVVKVEWDDD